MSMLRRRFAVLLALCLALAAPAGAASTLVGCSGLTTTWGHTISMHLGTGVCIADIGMSEDLSKFQVQRGGLALRNLAMHVATNNASSGSTVRSRKNLAAGLQSFGVPANTTGQFTDATNSDSLTAGDVFDGEYTGGGGPGEFVTGIISAELAATVPPVACVMTASTYLYQQNPSTTLYARPWGALGYTGTATEADGTVQFLVRAGGLAKGLQFNIRNATTATTTVTLRVNGADTALAVTAGASATGHFVDTTHQVRVAPGDLINFAVETGAGSGPVGIQMAGLYIESDTDQCDLGSSSGYAPIYSVGAITDYSLALLGGVGPGGGDSRQLVVPFPTRIGALRVLHSAVWGGNAGTFTVHVNGAPTGVTVSLPDGDVAGWDSSAAGTYATVAAGDRVDVRLTSPGTFATYLHGTGLTLNYDPDAPGVGAGASRTIGAVLQ